MEKTIKLIMEIEEPFNYERFLIDIRYDLKYSDEYNGKLIKMGIEQ